MFARTVGAITSLGMLALVASCSLFTTGDRPEVPGELACDGADPLALGAVVTNITDPEICVGGGSGTDYVLVVFDSSHVTGSTVSLSVLGTGLETVPATAPTSVTPKFSIANSSITNSQSGFKSEFERSLREREIRDLTQRFPTARRQRSSAVLRDMIPAQVTLGQIINLNTNSTNSCNNPIIRGGRVAAISERAIVVADTGNPTGGFTDLEFQSIATTFDTLLDPVDVGAFGSPEDIDNNGHVLLFFTRTVNELTQPGDRGIIGGFFYARDLFPQQDENGLTGCAGSNVGELFYLAVPDENGTINGNPRTKADIVQVTLGTVAHEYQHLINASRRLYVNTTASDFEVTWLNEGLSHIAEELVFYASTGLQPRENIDLDNIRASQARVDAFNSFEISNFGRYNTYLSNPSGNSPYGGDDSLETRGATWSMLRYLADQHATTDGDIWKQLVNSTTTGLANLSTVFPNTVMLSIRDWATSVLTDDLGAPVPAAYQQPSWNFRSIYPALSVDPFPLKVVALTDNDPAITEVVGGGVVFFRFRVQSGQEAHLTVSTETGATLPKHALITVVRTR